MAAVWAYLSDNANCGGTRRKYTCLICRYAVKRRMGLLPEGGGHATVRAGAFRERR